MRAGAVQSTGLPGKFGYQTEDSVLAMRCPWPGGQLTSPPITQILRITCEARAFTNLSRIRAVRLGSLPRARRGGPSHHAPNPNPNRHRRHPPPPKLIRSLFVVSRRAGTRCSLLPVAPLTVDQQSLAIVSLCPQAIAFRLRKRSQAGAALRRFYKYIENITEC